MLVVTALDDVTADLVIQVLNERKVPAVRLDLGDFPTSVTTDAYLGQTGISGHVITETRALDLARVRSVYWRRPSPYTSSADLTEQDAQWCVEQARYGLGGILAALPGAHYVNHPWRNRDAEYKPAQLATAARCGLPVLPTLITNDPGKATRFAIDHGPVVYKPLRNSDYLSEDAQALTVWVDEVDPVSIGPGLAQTMHLFQRRLDKVADIRLTAVGEHVFAVRIDGSPGLDWRRDYDALRYTLVEPPPAVVKGVHAYLDAFHLSFGAFDFGLDRAGRWWMYECNPNGQWAWFPAHITERIAQALANQLQCRGQLHDC
ncbi:ATP-grasp ribosomal peptide maturase [Streptomyces luomodiensis]|uniref:ATP-grasp ribosomal peptide maturase n=1 Tax=Streptomyces luomodiensis TaxID=3026192 RepID=UPI00287BA2E5|nr:ATP-grasp ribosomal peptide maturase [Streptomyces sp. SCA4-21]